jgi:hypothetical protein
MESLATSPDETGTRPARTAARWAPAAWAALSFALFLASSLGIFIVNTAVRLLSDVPHVFEVAEWPIVWGALAMTGVMMAGRLAFGRWLRVGATAIVVAVVGIGLSAVVNVVLQQWAIARFGSMDADYIGWTAGVFALLVGLAVAAFGVFVAPRDAAQWPLAFVVVGFGLTTLIVAANVPGLANGIDPHSWPLAIWLVISGLYAAAVTIASVMKARRPAATPER